MSKLQEVAKAVESGKAKLIPDIVQEALDAGDDPTAILNEGIVATMAVMGAKFQVNEISLPELLVAAKAKRRGVEALKPHLASDSARKYGTYIIGTVAGDLHDTDNILSSLLIESVGFKVIDLGVDVSAERFIKAVKANPDCKVVGAFAHLTTTMDSLKNTVQKMIEAGCTSQVKIMIGGRHITQAFADELGADAYASDAGAAATKAVELALKQKDSQRT